jgi:hypothetical protein
MIAYIAYRHPQSFLGITRGAKLNVDKGLQLICAKFFEPVIDIVL